MVDDDHYDGHDDDEEDDDGDEDIVEDGSVGIDWNAGRDGTAVLGVATRGKNSFESCRGWPSKRQALL